MDHNFSERRPVFRRIEHPRGVPNPDEEFAAPEVPDAERRLENLRGQMPDVAPEVLEMNTEEKQRLLGALVGFTDVIRSKGLVIDPVDEGIEGDPNRALTLKIAQATEKLIEGLKSKKNKLGLYLDEGNLFAECYWKDKWESRAEHPQTLVCTDFETMLREHPSQISAMSGLSAVVEKNTHDWQLSMGMEPSKKVFDALERVDKVTSIPSTEKPLTENEKKNLDEGARKAVEKYGKYLRLAKDGSLYANTVAFFGASVPYELVYVNFVEDFKSKPKVVANSLNLHSQSLEWRVNNVFAPGGKKEESFKALANLQEDLKKLAQEEKV
ncbi:MAG: hypothetical protein ABIA92_00880 [Patescibacteria group bacterium]